MELSIPGTESDGAIMVLVPAAACFLCTVIYLVTRRGQLDHNPLILTGSDFSGNGFEYFTWLSAGAFSRWLHEV